MVEVARRLCDDNHVVANEVWSYHTIGDQVRFTLVHRSKETSPSRVEASKTPKKPIAAPAQIVKKAAKPAAKPAPKPAAKASKAPSKPAAKKAKPAAKARKPAKAQKRK